MKAAIVIAEGLKQVMLSPENDAEKKILDLFREPSQDLSVEFKVGNFFDRLPSSAHGYRVQESKSGILRAYDDADSLMIVIRPKPTRYKCSNCGSENLPPHVGCSPTLGALVNP